MKRKPMFLLLGAAFIASSCATVVAQTRGGERPFISMDQRIEQLLGFIQEPPDCAIAQTGIDLALETLYGGLRPVPSADLIEETEQADRKLAAAEKLFAEALEQFARGGQCPEQQGRALDLKLFIEQMNEVAVAVGRVTRGCGVGKPCEGLVTLLDEETGHEVQRNLKQPLVAPFWLKLRSPFVPWRTVADWQEDVFVTEPIARGECVAIFKETRGLMLKLRLQRIDVVRDPWATPMLARGTLVPVWALEWVPSQYGKTWNICNTAESGLVTTVSQRVKQDIPLNYFWRYFGSAHPKKW